jgi:ABC-type lipoprotein release transport system permease subunit
MYGVVSQAVAYRLREVAIRVAIGASPLGIITTMTRGAVVTGIAGLGVGLVAAYTLSSTLEALLYGVRPRDVLSFVVASAALLLVTLLAAVIPAWRAVRVDPASLLRAE